MQATEESKWKERRIYKKESVQDTIDSLAIMLQLSITEEHKWAHILVGNKNMACEVSVPNTGYIDVASYVWGYLTPFLRGYKSNLANRWEQEGLKVVYSSPTQTTKMSILSHLKSDDIYKFAYIGHGGYGFMTNIKNNTGQSDLIIGGKYTKHALSEFHVIACESEMEHKKWAENVSNTGWLRTARGIISPIRILTSELFGGESYFYDELGTIP